MRAIALPPLLLSALCAAAWAAAPLRAEPVAFEIVDAAEIPHPLTGDPGDPAAGPAAAARGACADCHALGPGGDLAETAARLSEGALRLSIVNLPVRSRDAVGHAFYDLPPFDPAAPEPPATPLSAAEVEALVAWLRSLSP